MKQALIRYPLSRWNVLRADAATSDAADGATNARVILSALKQAVEAHEVVQSLPVALSNADRERDVWLEQRAGNPGPIQS